MTDSWTELLSRPALFLPHPDPYQFTKHLSKSQSHSTLRAKPKLASRHQFPSSRLLVTQLVRRATTTRTKPSNLGDRAPKLDPLYFPVVDLTVPACEEDMDSVARPRRGIASSRPAAKKRGPAFRSSEVDRNAGYNEHDDENDNNNDTEGRTAFHDQSTVLQDPLYLPGDQPQPPSTHQQYAEPRLGNNMTEEFTSPNSLISSSMHPPSNSNSCCSMTLHARATTSALAFSMVDLEMNPEANAKIAMMKLEQKGNELDSSSTHSAPPPSWSEAAFDTQLVSGESPSTSTPTSTSSSISISASSACRKSPVPGMAIADKDTIAGGMPTRSTSTFIRRKSKRWVGRSKSQRRPTSEDDGGECKSDVADTAVDEAHSAFASTSTPPSSLLISGENQTYVYKHRRTASLGNAAVSLFLGMEQRKETGKAHQDQNSDDESEHFEFSEEWIKNGMQANSTQALQSNQHTKRARFVILGSESDMDLPSNINSGWSSSTSHPRLTVRTEVSASSSATRPQTQQPLQRPPSSFLVSTSSTDIQRRDALSDSHKPLPRRRWTLANVMTDEAISDESLVRELERMRELGIWKHELLLKEGERLNEGETILVDADSMWEIWEGMLDREKEYIVDEDEAGVVNLSPSFSYHLGSASWLTAQRALLICRELLMTERHYHALLLSLLAGDTHTRPPTLMLHYATELMRASAVVLRAMEQQPNASGVARAFVDNVEEVEGAYVRWCGVAGGWFSGGGVEESGNSNAKLKRNRSRYRSSIDSAITPAADVGGLESEDGQSPQPVSPLKRTVRTWRRSLPSVASLGEATASIYGYGYGTTSRSLRRRNKDKDPDKVAEEEQVGSDVSSPPSPSSPSSGQSLVSRPPRVRSKLAVRELAILPTQRVLRYVLLYRNLLSNIPPNSSSRVFVEQAVDAACRIADKCNRAQGNAAFIVAGAGAGESSSAAPSEAEPTTRRSNSGRTTATTSSDELTPPTSVEGERQPEEVEEDEEESKRDLNEGCHLKLSSSIRRVSMSVSFMGWSRN